MKIILDIGDIIYAGKFKNKKEMIKKFGTDSKGQPTINNRKALTFRVAKFMRKMEGEKKMIKLKNLIKEETLIKEAPKQMSAKEAYDTMIDMITKR